jgi:hypothetical protein
MLSYGQFQKLLLGIDFDCANQLCSSSVVIKTKEASLRFNMSFGTFALLANSPLDAQDRKKKAKKKLKTSGS